jgi:pimeloyl-ACP methyl ester carboxylesterase
MKKQDGGKGGTGMFIDTGKGKVFCRALGQGSPVIMIHGFGSSSAQWDFCIDRLVGAGMQVIVPDLPGFGQSYLPERAINASSYRHTIIDIMDSLGIERATLVGSSMGGLVAWLTAANAPQRVDALVLVSPAGALSHRDADLRRSKRPGRGLVKSGLALTLFAALARLGLFDPLTRRMIAPLVVRSFGDTAVRPEIKDLLFQEAKKSRIVFKQRLRMDAVSDGARQLQAIACPTLLMWGDQDKVIPFSAMDFFVENMPEARIKVYFGVGHLPMLEIPAEFSEDVAGFLKSKLQRPLVTVQETVRTT